MPVVEGVHFRKMSNLERFTRNKIKMKKKKKKISETVGRRRKISLTTNLISLTISKLFGLSIKAGKIKLKKKLSDASMSTVERVP